MVAASSSFRRKAAGGDGASWTDFANAAKAAAQGLEAPALRALEKDFRALHLEPLLEGLEKLKEEGTQRLQELLASGGRDALLFEAL